MNKNNRILGIIVFILTICVGCEKDDARYFSLGFKLVDEFGSQRSRFYQDDSIIFEFYLSNFSGAEGIYLRPCSEFIQYLNLYREDSTGNYVFCGRPDYYCVAIADLRRIGNEETVLIGRMPWTWLAKVGWPGKDPGSYYVGDTLSLVINDSTLEFVERIYLEIE